MEEKILALLMTAFSGVRNDGLKQLARVLALQTATEEEAKALVDKLTKAQVDGFIKLFRADVDKEVSDSNKTFEANLKKKFDLVEKKEPEPKPKADDKPDDKLVDIAAVVKAAVSEAVKPFQDELTGFKAGEVAKSRLRSLNEKLNTCNDETFKAVVLKNFARMKFETDEEFNGYLTDMDGDIAKANQGVADSKLLIQNRPLPSKGNSGEKQASEVEVKEVIDKIRI